MISDTLEVLDRALGQVRKLADAVLKLNDEVIELEQRVQHLERSRVEP